MHAERLARRRGGLTGPGHSRRARELRNRPRRPVHERESRAEDGGQPQCRGAATAPSLAVMNSFFATLRGFRFRRGPQRLLGGIAGGLAELTGLNVWIMRLLVLASFLLPVLGVGAYLAVWLLTPWQDGTIPLERLLDRG